MAINFTDAGRNSGDREAAMNMVIALLNASPNLLESGLTGEEATKEVTALADGILEYITKVPQKT